MQSIRGAFTAVTYEFAIHRQFLFAAAAYNLVRMRTLEATT